MGVITQADLHRQEVSESIAQFDIHTLTNIQKELENMIDPEIWGGSDWSKEFRKEVEKDIKYLGKVKRKIYQMKQRY